jgi:hypothetical protein
MNMLKVLKKVDKDKIRAFEEIAALYGLESDPHKGNVVDVARKYKRKCELLESKIKKLYKCATMEVPYVLESQDD